MIKTQDPDSVNKMSYFIGKHYQYLFVIRAQLEPLECTSEESRCFAPLTTTVSMESWSNDAVEQKEMEKEYWNGNERIMEKGEMKWSKVERVFYVLFLQLSMEIALFQGVVMV